MALSSEDTSFVRLTSLAVHDLRTPLATVSGFARTLERTELDERAKHFVTLMVAACDQLAGLLDDLGLAARIESGLWEPNLQTTDTRELASAAEAVPEGAVTVVGPGGAVRTDVDAARRAVYHLARCAIRHGALDRLDVGVEGSAVALSPVSPEVAPIVLAENLRDLGAAVSQRVLAAVGASAELEGDRVVVRFPT
jgi:signal transduction histidine kinase